MLMRGTRGFTLMEVLVATVVGAVFVAGVSAVEVSRARLDRAQRLRASLGSHQVRASLASLQMEKAFEVADRVNIITRNPGNIQVRVFAPTVNCVPGGCTGAALNPCCFTVAANYRWDQYKLNGNVLQYFRGIAGVCPPPTALAAEITQLAIQYIDGGGLPPLGAEPFVTEDNNIIRFSMWWNNGLAGSDGLTHVFGGDVTSRAISFGDVNAGAGASGENSGDGLAPSGAGFDPPAGC